MKNGKSVKNESLSELYKNKKHLLCILFPKMAFLPPLEREEKLKTMKMKREGEERDKTEF